MSDTKRPRGRPKGRMTTHGWHYTAAGDYPPVGASVLVCVADLGEWTRAIVKGDKVATVGLCSQNSRYQQTIPDSCIELWEGVPVHCVVVAWRAEPKMPDTDLVKWRVAMAQKDMAKGAELHCLLASAYAVDPLKNQVYINGLERKWQRNYGKVMEGSSILGYSETGGKERTRYEDADGRLYSVELRYEHGVIVQIDKLGEPSRYARDFPRARRIYPTETDALRVLMAEAEMRGWRRVA